MKATMNRSIETLAKKYRLKLILLFGSRAGIDFDSESDYDIALYGENVLDEKTLLDITAILSELLKSERIDVVDIKKAPPLLKKRIFENYRILYEVDPILKYQLELTSEYEFQEAEELYIIRRERLGEALND